MTLFPVWISRSKNMTRRIVAIPAFLVSLLLGLTLDVAAQADGRATYHVFPQVAYGALQDGSFYQSMLLVDNPSGGSTAKCFLTGSAVFFSLDPGQWNLYLYTSSGSLVTR